MENYPGGGGGGGGRHWGMVWLSCAEPPRGAVVVGWTVRLKKAGGDCPTISIIGGLNLLELLFPFVSTVICKPKGIFGFSET